MTSTHPHQLDWVIDKRLLKITFTSVVELSDVNAVTYDILEWQKQCPNSLQMHLIYDMCNLKIFPADVLKMLTIPTKTLYNSTKTGWILLVTKQKALHYIMNTLAHILPIRYVGFDNLESAISYIKQTDPTLE
jgi:hypothetical protein